MEPWCFSDQNPDDNFTVLDQNAIEKHQDDDVTAVANVLSVSRTLACSLLMQHKWCVETAIERFFSDLRHHGEQVGLESEKISCEICFQESNPNLKFLSLACSHPFCVDCWEKYISISIQDGPGCLTLTCPVPKCEVVVGLDTIDALASPEDRNKYYTYLMRSYVEHSKKRKWCPSPGCEFAVELFNPMSWRNFEVKCDCLHKFCFKCGEESHRPVDCETARRWVERGHTLDSMNKLWILAYTKPCPMCNRPIEKHQGCNHMTCPNPCGHHFCWACLGSWKDYNHKCDNNDRPDDAAKKQARAEIERMSNADTERARMMEKLSKLSNLTPEVDFVSKAWEQVIECRRVLKWSNANSYYMSLNGHRKRKFFEFLQGQAESVLEKLDHCLKRGMDEIMVEFDSSRFSTFKERLMSLTCVTGNHFEGFLRALEEDDLCIR